MRTSWALPLLLTLAAMVLASSPAAASCAVLPALDDHLAIADAVFVGTVIGLSNADRTALVSVEEIWHGPELDATVTVHGGPDDLGTFTSVDRTYVAGGRYLFAVMSSEGSLRDDGCSATREWPPDLADRRPTDFSRPTATNQPDGPGPLPLTAIIVGSAVLIIAAVSLLAFRTRRNVLT